MLLKTEVLVAHERDTELAEQFERMGLPAPESDEYELCPVIFNLGKDLEFFIKAQEVEFNGQKLTGLLLDGNESMIVVNINFLTFSKKLGFE